MGVSLNRAGRRVLVVVLALAAAGLMGFGANQAPASHVSCGVTITADTTLDSDLVDCPNNGVVIGAYDITLDLNGHRIDGDGTEFADCPKDEICDVGVVNDRNDGVRIKGGSTREFAVGVLVSRARDNRVVDISSSRNVFFGAVVGGSSHGVVRDSSLSNNIAPEGDGIGLFGSDHITIAGNSIQDNPGPGIHVADSTDNLIKGNRLSDNGPAILVEEANRNKMRENRVRRGGGILVGPGNRNVIARNHVSRAQESISATGRENLIARNVVIDARGRGISLGVDFAHGPDFGGVDNIVRRNKVRGSGGDAFLINHKGSYVLKRNVARGAKDDGFDIESRSTRLAKNRATRNADLGIDAARGVIDGGGNRASGNGDSRQCRNVRCS
jgi:parallel beta-helix repeat protein